ncbi:two-component system response regulator [Cellulophaga sp. Hel_I_12]|uniref:response regulator n=1 Tax=Cellulophaga sp. Hel_I_12 TaxID=1249972 RepID=UPI000647A13A|nr:response regulator [Cellulophaga sp. Hel_I_12]
MIVIKSIFIIDDDSITVFGIKKLLSSVVICDHITSFKNGKDAIQLIKSKITKPEELPDVIFLDLNMPVMDGWGFLDVIIALPIKKMITINIVTSSISNSDRQRAMTYKLKTQHRLTYNTKPLNKEEILKITSTS